MRATSDVTLSIIKKSASILGGLLFLVISTRFLGPANRGEYMYILNSVTILATILFLGITSTMPQHIRSSNSNRINQHHFFTISTVQLFIYLILSSLLLLLNLRTESLVFFLTTITTYNIHLNNISILTNFRRNTYAFVSGQIISCILILLAYYLLESSFYIVITIWLIKELTTTAVIITNSDLKLVSIKGTWKKILRESTLPLIVTILTAVNYRVGILLLKWSSISNYEIGIYSLGVSIAEYTWIISDVFKDVLYKANSRKSDLYKTSQYIRISFTLIFIIFIFTVLFGSNILKIVFGSDFTESYPYMVLIFLAVPFTSHSKLIGTLLQAHGKWKIYLYIFITATTFNILINITCIRHLGPYASACGTIVSYVTSGLLMLIWYRKRFNLRFSDHFIIKKSDLIAILDKFAKREGA